MPQEHHTLETKDWGATQCPPDELPVLFLEPDMVAMEHIRSINYMVTGVCFDCSCQTDAIKRAPEKK
jgi:hypothetical protein